MLGVWTVAHTGFSRVGGPSLGPHSKDLNIPGSRFGSPYSGNHNIGSCPEAIPCFQCG